jgi:hypothetical protein
VEPRTVDELGEGERDATWQYADPIWPAHYTWHPEEGWVYCTRSMPAWRPSAVGTGTVTTATITHGACGERFSFVEVARFRAGGWVLFTPSGPVAMPDEIGTDWEEKHLFRATT